MPAKTITIEQIITRYAKDLAFVADEDESPATGIHEFIDQLHTASQHLEMAHFDTDDVDAAATQLDAARNSSGSEQQVFLKQAIQHLLIAGDQFDEYALMV